jgi:pimeloyl-ACP methyl ester carboxylesterase
MRRLLIVVTLLVVPVVAQAQTATARTAPAKKTAPAHYGSNPAAGATFTHDGVKLYYEVYGTGEPLLMVHGNGGSIFDLSMQIAYFRRQYRVIAMDSRDQGKSADSVGSLTYEKMADDLAALLDHLQVPAANVLGWSDGGIEALLLGIRHPAKVKKIVSMAANLNPSDKALRPDVLELVKKMMADVPAAARNTPEGKRELKVTGMMLVEPNIDVKALEKITAPTMILASDHDVIADEHTLDIYHHIPNSQLAIFPDALHTIPWDDPARFNATVERFLRTPFRKINRIDDTVKSLEQMRAAQGAP